MWTLNTCFYEGGTWCMCMYDANLEGEWIFNRNFFQHGDEDMNYNCYSIPVPFIWYEMYASVCPTIYPAHISVKFLLKFSKISMISRSLKQKKCLLIHYRFTFLKEGQIKIPMQRESRKKRWPFLLESCFTWGGEDLKEKVWDTIFSCFASHGAHYFTKAAAAAVWWWRMPFSILRL